MHIAPYLSFNGNCETAFKFYEHALGGKIQAMMTFGSTPAAGHVPAESQGKIMHARLVVDGNTIMGTDATPDHPYKGIVGASVTLGIDKPEDAERIFKALSENGKITMPLQQTFWAVRFGMVTDQFGVPWMVNCEGAK